MGFKRYGPYQDKRYGHVFYKHEHDSGRREMVWAHREVMEQHLGRKLKTWEHVHHKNEDPTDNRVENLEIMTPGEHTNHHRPAPEMWPVVCPECGKETERQARDIRRNQHKQKKAGPFCGQVCAGRFNARKRMY